MGPGDGGWSENGRSLGEGAVSLVLVTRGESQHILAPRGVQCGPLGPVAPQVGGRSAGKDGSESLGGPPFSCVISLDKTSARGGVWVLTIPTIKVIM